MRRSPRGGYKPLEYRTFLHIDSKPLLFSALATALNSVLNINRADLRVENFRNDSASAALRLRSTREMSRDFFADMRAYLNFASIFI
jgi:hypothetical protein